MPTGNAGNGDQPSNRNYEKRPDNVWQKVAESAALRQREQNEIDRQVDRLASLYKVDVQRVRRILESMSYYRTPGCATKSELHDEILRCGVLLRPHLEQALKSLPAEDALGLFENEDLTELTKRVLGTPYLGFMGHRLHALDELESLVESFLYYLGRNQEHIVNTGYPATSFEPSPWLEQWLAKTYYTRLPARAEKSRPQHLAGDAQRAETSAEPVILECTYTYTWTTAAPATDQGGSRAQPRQCAYEEADLLHGLDPDDARRLTEMRPRLFELKVETLKLLVQCLRSRDVATLRAECAQSVGEALSGRGFEFCIGMDRLYRAYAPNVSTETQPSIGGLLPGGLSCLLEVVWHIEQEVRIGTWCRTRKALGPLVAIDPAGRTELTIDDYFDVVRTPHRQNLDSALAVLEALQTQANEARDAYYQEVNKAFDKFYGGSTSRPEDRPEFSRIIESKAQDFTEFYKAELKRLVSQSLGGAPVRKASPVGNVFRKEDEDWTITYDGQSIRLRHMKGLHYIHYLLAHPNKLIHVLVIVWSLEKPEVTANLNHYARMSIEQLEKEGLSPSRWDSEKVRLSVRDCITRAIKKIGRHYPDLAKHFDHHIELGSSCMYVLGNVKWIL